MKGPKRTTGFVLTNEVWRIRSVLPPHPPLLLPTWQCGEHSVHKYAGNEYWGSASVVPWKSYMGQQRSLTFNMMNQYWSTLTRFEHKLSLCIRLCCWWYNIMRLKLTDQWDALPLVELNLQWLFLGEVTPCKLLHPTKRVKSESISESHAGRAGAAKGPDVARMP